MVPEQKSIFQKLWAQPRVRLAAIALLLLVAGGLFARHWWREMRWRWIVVHHTGSDFGNLEHFRRQHVEERQYDDIAYHFLINNGANNPDHPEMDFNTTMGQIEVSERWKRRQHNASTGSNYLNEYSIAVVLVGNFENHAVPPLQYEMLIQLLSDLSEEYNIPPDRIIGHREMKPEDDPTLCPGKHLNMELLRRAIAEKQGVDYTPLSSPENH